MGKLVNYVTSLHQSTTEDYVDRMIDDKVDSMLESTEYEKDYLNSTQKVEATNKRLKTAKVDYLRLSRLQNKFSQLQREVDTNKELYNNYYPLRCIHPNLLFIFFFGIFASINIYLQRSIFFIDYIFIIKATFPGTRLKVICCPWRFI